MSEFTKSPDLNEYLQERLKGVKKQPKAIEGPKVCEYCKSPADLPMDVISLCLPIPRMEEQIDKWGRGTWYHETEKDKEELTVEQQDELLEMVVYDNLINTTKMGYCCKQCRIKELHLYDKYYPEVTGNTDYQGWSVTDHQNRYSSYKDYIKNK